MAADELGRPGDGALHRVEVDDHVGEGLEVLLLAADLGGLALQQEPRRVGDEALRLVDGVDLTRERAAAVGGGGVAIPRREVGIDLLHEVEHRQAVRHHALHHRRGNQEAVDLVRALEDAVDAGVAVLALERVVGDEAVAAHHLQRFVDDEVERLGAEDLHDRLLDRVLLDRLDDLLVVRRIVAIDARDEPVDQPGGAVRDRVGYEDAHRDVGDLALDRAEVGERRLELLAVGGVAHRKLEALARGAERSGAELQAADVQDVERDLVAEAEVAEEVLGGDEDVLQNELRRRRALDAELVLLWAGAHAFCRALDQERGELLAVDLGEDGEEIGEAAVGDELLHAAQAVAAVGRDRLRLRAERVAARPRLGERVRGNHLAAHEPWQIPLLLLAAAVEEEGQGADAGVRAPGDRERRQLERALADQGRRRLADA